MSQDWSVLVAGHARVVTEPDAVRRPTDLAHTKPWPGANARCGCRSSPHASPGTELLRSRGDACRTRLPGTCCARPHGASFRCRFGPRPGRSGGFTGELGIDVHDALHGTHEAHGDRDERGVASGRPASAAADRSRSTRPRVPLWSDPVSLTASLLVPPLDEPPLRETPTANVRPGEASAVLVPSRAASAAAAPADGGSVPSRPGRSSGSRPFVPPCARNPSGSHRAASWDRPTYPSRPALAVQPWCASGGRGRHTGLDGPAAGIDCPCGRRPSRAGWRDEVTPFEWPPHGAPTILGADDSRGCGWPCAGHRPLVLPTTAARKGSL